MARLFSALLPPDGVLDELRTALRAVHLDGLRWTPAERWHVTLGFFGDDDDPHRRSSWLRRRVDGHPAPRLRIAGGGTFPGVFWARVQPADGDAERLRRLAKAAGAGRRGFSPHLTVARWRRDAEVHRGGLADSLREFAGSWFTPAEVVLLRSDPVPGGVAYSVLRRCPLRPPASP